MSKPLIAGEIITHELYLEIYYLLSLLAQVRDAEGDGVAGLEVFRLWLHTEAHARGGAGNDDVARLQDKKLRAVPDDMPAIEDHGFGIAALALLAVDVEPHVEILRVFDLVLGGYPRADWAEGLRAFALDPLPAALKLKTALGYVVGEAVTGEHVHRLVLRQIA